MGNHERSNRSGLCVKDSLLFLGGHILKESEMPNVRALSFQPP